MLLNCGSAAAQTTVHTALDVQLDFNSPSSYYEKGWALDAAQGTMIAGGREDGLGNTGWVQVFQRNTSATTLQDAWDYQGTLAGSGLSTNSWFGYAVAVDKSNANTAAVTARGDNSVYVFSRSSSVWSESVILPTPVSGISCSGFGVDLGVDSGHLIVGTEANRAYVYGTGSWDEPYELTLDSPATPVSFGSSVDVSGQYAVVGDPGANAVYFYRNAGGDWVEESIVDSTDYSGSELGSSVSIWGDYAIVGGPAADSSIGLAVIYHRETSGSWTKVGDTLTPSDSDSYADYYIEAQFGCSVDIGENYAIVGARGGTDDGYLMGSYCGASYVFSFDDGTWSELGKLIPDEQSLWECYGSEFGAAVAVDDSGDTIDYVVGAYAYDSDAGAAYVHQQVFRPGDADRDGDVDEDDAAILAANWLRDDGVGWGEGNFNTDNIVDDQDLALLATNCLSGVTLPNPVPEPSALVLLACGALGVFFVRVRRSN